MELFILIVLVLLIALIRARFTSPVAKGHRGESRVRKRLKRGLPANEYVVYNNVTLPSAMGKTQIDHIILSRYGIFVIETKNYSGWIFGNAKSKKWTQTFSGHKSQFQNPLHQNYKHVKAVQSFFLLAANQIYSVVAFVGDSTFKTDLPSNVTDLKGLCPYILSKSMTHFQPAEFEDMIVKLNMLKAGMDPGRHDPSEIRMEPDCPRCGAPMARRRAKRGKNAGREFWGCSRFPYCRGHQGISSGEEQD